MPRTEKLHPPMPITSRSDLQMYLEADLRAPAAPRIRRWRPWLRFQYPLLAWQRHLRRVEHIVNTRRQAIWRPYVLWVRFRFRAHSMKLGFSIPPNVFGPGLSVAHWGTIVVNDEARVGANCRIHPGTCLATKDGHAPQIGNDCYLGPGSKIVGGVVLGDKVTVGANAVVTKSFGDGAILAGVPARDIRGANELMKNE